MFSGLMLYEYWYANLMVCCCSILYSVSMFFLILLLLIVLVYVSFMTVENIHICFFQKCKYGLVEGYLVLVDIQLCLNLW